MSGESDGRDLSKRQELQPQCSMTHWWPRLQNCDVPLPVTVRVEAQEQPILDGSMSMPVLDAEELGTAAEKVGGPPAFVRSDLMSAKHNMADGSRVETIDPEDLKLNIGTLIEQHTTAWMTPDPQCYYVREWLNLWHRFSSFADSGTPIAAEVRVFLDDGKYHDAAFYWPEDAIWEHSATEDNWRELLDETREKAMDGEAIWREHAAEVAEEFDQGYWSVDFALTEGGRWYCLDMARGELSWHPENCEPPEGIR